MALDTRLAIGDKGYYNNVQPPLSEIPGSAPGRPKRDLGYILNAIDRPDCFSMFHIIVCDLLDRRDRTLFCLEDRSLSP